jgi:hypothetical protein
MKRILLLIVWNMALLPSQEKLSSPKDAALYRLAKSDLKTFAQELTRAQRTELGCARTIVGWLAEHLEWKATDYKQRTVQEIIDRGGGNCNELAMVALAAMKELKLALRRVHEINIHVNTPRRGETARAMVKEKGNSYSVFGRRHNDHVWVEVYDSTSRDWFPADPSIGVVGLEEWMPARFGFGKRFSLNPISEDMVAPFAMFAADSSGKFTISRTRHYTIDEFDRLYSGKLHNQRAWKQWTETIELLDGKVAGAFAGSINLHEYEANIDSLALTYEQLRAGGQSK